MRADKISKLIIYIILSVVGFMMVFPFIWMIINSFRTNYNIMNYPLVIFDKNFSLQNYIDVFKRLNIGRAFYNSLIFAGLTTVTTLLTSSIAGYIFAKHSFKGKEIIFMLFLVTLMAPVYVTTIPLYILVNKFGLIDTLIGIMLPFFIHAFGIFMMRQFIAGIPDSLIEAARIDGASEIKIFIKIILPLSKSSLSVLGILVFLWRWDQFLWPLVVTQSSDMQTLPVWMAHFNQAEAQLAGPSMAGATLVILPVLIVYLFFQRNFVKGMTMSGLKY